ncbi:MAG: ABC transporter ATP-binding protein, partial [Gemmatimonadetes bacterium]|nr:ABC transporter ATP-binding protein [Gemmatimonadota bacterium]
MGDASDKKKKKKVTAEAWAEARALVWQHRGKLGIGMVLMLISRIAGLVPAAASKFLIDDVIGKGRSQLLLPLALGVAGATIIQAITSFSLSQVISVTAQRAINDMRRRVMEKVTRLPVGYFDSTQSGVLVSRIM